MLYVVDFDQWRTKSGWTTFSIENLEDAISNSKIVIVNFRMVNGGKTIVSDNEPELETPRLVSFYRKHNVVLMSAQKGINDHPPGLKEPDYLNTARVAVYATSADYPDTIVPFLSEESIRDLIESLSDNSG